MHFDREYFAHLLDVHFLTYDDVAERIGSNKTTVYRWASGRNEPSKPYVRKLAKALGVDPLDLMKEDEGVPLTKPKGGWK